MKVEQYERAWMWASAGLIALFLVAILVPAALQAVHPPSHFETVDPAALASHAEFGTPTVSTRSDGRIVASIVASTFAFSPDPIVVPAGLPVTFRITSSDVMHGFQIVGTNANSMAIPGYVSQFSLTFTQRGEYIITCNEYCGILHHAMVGKLIVQ